MASLMHPALLVTWVATIAVIVAKPLTPDTFEPRGFFFRLGNWFQQPALSNWLKNNFQAFKNNAWVPNGTEPAVTVLAEMLVPIIVDQMKDSLPKFSIPNRVPAKTINSTKETLANLLHNDFLTKILSNNEISRQIAATMREAKERSLPFHLIDTLTELYGSQTSCVQLLLCEWAPTIWSMQNRLDTLLGGSQSPPVDDAEVRNEDTSTFTPVSETQNTNTPTSSPVLGPRKRRQTEEDTESESQANDLYQVYAEQCQKLFSDCRLLL